MTDQKSKDTPLVSEQGIYDAQKKGHGMFWVKRVYEQDRQKANDLLRRVGDELELVLRDVDMSKGDNSGAYWQRACDRLSQLLQEINTRTK